MWPHRPAPPQQMPPHMPQHMGPPPHLAPGPQHPPPQMMQRMPPQMPPPQMMQRQPPQQHFMAPPGGHRPMAPQQQMMAPGPPQPQHMAPHPYHNDRPPPAQMNSHGPRPGGSNSHGPRPGGSSKRGRDEPPNNSHSQPRSFNGRPMEDARGRPPQGASAPAPARHHDRGGAPTGAGRSMCNTPAWMAPAASSASAGSKAEPSMKRDPAGAAAGLPAPPAGAGSRRGGDDGGAEVRKPSPRPPRLRALRSRTGA